MVGCVPEARMVKANVVILSHFGLSIQQSRRRLRRLRPAMTPGGSGVSPPASPMEVSSAPAPGGLVGAPPSAPSAPALQSAPAANPFESSATTASFNIVSDHFSSWNVMSSTGAEVHVNRADCWQQVIPNMSMRVD